MASRPGYRKAVHWVAVNDSPGEDDALDCTAVSELVTVALVADLFDKSTEKVAEDVVRTRQKQAEKVTIRGHELDASKIDFFVEPHSSSSQLCIGVYPPGMTADQVRRSVDGTFGGHFEQFCGGRFRFIAYTD